MTLGERLSRVLESVEGTMWEHEFTNKTIDLTQEGFRAAVKIFATAVMDKQWDLQEKENIDFEDRIAMSERCGQEIRKLVKTYTDIDTFNFYK